MEITRRALGGVAVLDLEGRLIEAPADHEIAVLRAAIEELTVSGRVDIALNLAGVTHIDARGLGELVSALNTVRRHGGRLTLVAPPARVARLLAVTRLDSVFEIARSFESFGAFESFGTFEFSEGAARAI